MSLGNQHGRTNSSGRPQKRRLYSLVAIITALGLVLGGAFLAIPGQAIDVSQSPGDSIPVEDNLEVLPEEANPDEGSQEETTTEVSSAEEGSAQEDSTEQVEGDPATETPEAPSVDLSEDPSADPTVESGSEELVKPSESSDAATAKHMGASLATSYLQYQAGDSVELTGDSWGKNNKVQVTLMDSKGEVVLSTEASSNKDGSFVVTLKLPWNSSGMHKARALDGKDGNEVFTEFDVVGLETPSVTADMPDYPAGSTAMLTGKDWNPDEQVAIKVDDREGNTWEFSSVVDVAADGSIQVEVKLPSDNIPIFDVLATGQTTKRTAATTFTDSNTATITIRKAGSRNSDTGASPLDGAIFGIYDVGTSTSTTIPAGDPTYTCTTGVGDAPGGGPNASGECGVQVLWPSGTTRRFLVVEQTAPTGWDLLPEFATENSGSDPYRFNVAVSNGQSITVPNTGASSSQQWANRLDNPSWPGFCGLDVALLFDESTSISSSEWSQMKSAAANLALALQGTPSRVAQFSFSTTALTGKYVPLTSVQSATDATALAAQINAKSQSGGFTNWDEGLYQIAQKSESYDAVLILTDGDPTVYGTETSGNVRIVTVQEAVHSANAVKAEGTRIVGVGIGLASASAKNLAAISGPTVGSDYYLPAGFGDLDAALKEIASSQCGGTVVIEKQLGDSIPGTTGTDSNGWPFSAEVTLNEANTDVVATPDNEKTGVLNDKNGQLQYRFTGGEWPKDVRISELANPDKPGYTLGDIQCTRGDLSKPDPVNGAGFVDIDSLGIDETVSCIFLNSLDTGSLKVLKSVSNPDGASLPTTFGIDYECKISTVVTKSGTVNVAPGATGETVTGIPTGSTCTITEQTLPTIPGFTWSPVTYDPRNVDITTKGQTFTTKANNALTKNVGSLELSKTLTGGPADYDGPFTINYLCTKDGETNISGSRSIEAGNKATVTGLPEGFECVVSEPTLPTPPTGYSFSTPTFTPSDATVTIVDDQTVTVTTENTLTRDTGSLLVIKTVSNPGGASLPPTFVIDYECKIGDEVTTSGTLNVAPGAMGETVTGIPTGSTCTITEQTPPNVPGFRWSTVTYDPQNVDITTQGGTFTVEAITSLTKKVGSLELRKILSGGPADYEGPFTINYLCTKDDMTIGATARQLNGNGEISGSREVAAGQSAVVNGIPEGYECLISEPTLPTAPVGYTFGAPTFSPSDAMVTIVDDQTATVTTENTLNRDLGSLRISKDLLGTPVGFDPEFDVSYLCTLEGEEDISGSTTLSAGETVVILEESIPTGYECTVTEGPLPVLPTGYTWNSAVYSNNQGTEPGNTVTIVMDSVMEPGQDLPTDQMATVEIANSATFTSIPVPPSAVGSMTVTKVLNGGPYAFTGAFQIAYICSGPGGTLSSVLSLGAGDSATVFNIPVGFTCTVSESNLSGAPLGFTWSAPVITGSPTPVITEGLDASVTVTNTLNAEGAAIVGPASPPSPPAVPVEPASPDTTAVQPAGVPTSVPAGGGALTNLVNAIPTWMYLAALFILLVLAGGLAYRTRNQEE